jgi:hypothetical protein
LLGRQHRPRRARIATGSVGDGLGHGEEAVLVAATAIQVADGTFLHQLSRLVEMLSCLRSRGANPDAPSVWSLVCTCRWVPGAAAAQLWTTGSARRGGETMTKLAESAVRFRLADWLAVDLMTSWRDGGSSGEARLR